MSENNNQYSKEEVLLKAKDINLAYGEKVILRDLNFEIRNIVRPNVKQGQVVALIGRSGIGKTQMFRIMSGLQQPDSGEVTIDRDQHRVKAGEVGIVPQNYLLFNHRTIYENLRIGLDNANVVLTKDEKDRIIKDYSETFQLAEHLKKYPQQLSGGQRQRASIIQQVLTGNRFILLDEPFSGLDILMVDKVIELLLKISTLHEDNTLIIVSHDIENAAAISDMIWVLAAQPGKPGATITKEYDLCSMNLAWAPGIRNDPRFHELINDIRARI